MSYDSLTKLIEPFLSSDPSLIETFNKSSFIFLALDFLKYLSLNKLSNYLEDLGFFLRLHGFVSKLITII